MGLDMPSKSKAAIAYFEARQFGRPLGGTIFRGLTNQYLFKYYLVI
jgi:hypothetical protein